MKQIISTIAIATGLAVMSSCSMGGNKDNEAALQAQQNTINEMKIEMARQHVIDSMNEVARVEKEKQPAVAKTVVVRRSPSRNSSASTGMNSTQSYGGNSQPVAQTQAPVYQDAPAEAQKKGWSAKAKGAVIGTAVGAASGAIINKRNRGVGAIIGGVLGAGAGTGIGAIIDKKQGR
jgi:hypothetical protein